MVKITFATGSTRHSDDVGFSPQRLVNFYASPSPDGKSPAILRSVLGQESFADSGIGFLRAISTVNGVIYAVASGTLYSVSSGGITSALGSIPDDPVTTISGNGSNVTVAAGGQYFVWDGSALTQPTAGAFSSFGTVALIDQRTIITEKDGARFQWSDLADPSTLDALNFATNETRNDDTLIVKSNGRELWFFGQESIEIWYNTGQSAENAFARINGGALDTGILAANLSVKFDDGIFFIGDDRIAYITSGMSVAPVSSAPVNTAISESTPTHCFYYEDRGHKFCCIRFSDRPAWCFDVSTGVWHERSSGVDLGAWDVVGATKAYGDWYCGTSGGDVLKMTRNNQDVSYPLRRTAISRSLYLDGAQFSVASLELLGKFGESSLGRDAEVMMRISKDGGRTWGEEMRRSLGTVGERLTRAVFRSLGRQRDFSIEVAVTDTSDINIYADVNVKVT